ncbi:hypothetical protein LUZ60_005615 [Juncus effusus]|nr:hypothetical protein LUZ60_005615 [Juncus effusus]
MQKNPPFNMAHNYKNYHYKPQNPPFPFHLLIFLIILIIPKFISWRSNYESTIDQLLNYFHVTITLLPLLLLFLVHVLSSYDRKWVPLSDKESIFRAGGSPWGLGFMLVVIMFMISHQSYFHDAWFPLLKRHN